MADPFFSSPAPFLTKARKNTVTITAVTEKSFKKQPATIKKQAEREGFAGKAGQFLLSADGKDIFAGVNAPLDLYDFAGIADKIAGRFSKEALKETSFTIEGLSEPKDINTACAGWALSAYRFERYKKADYTAPVLLWPKEANKKRVQAMTESMCLIRNLINTPANDLTPAELEEAARALADKHKATLHVTKGKALETGYPLIHTVGKASETPPRLIELRWGNSKNPKICLVGKGVSFDTGGLNIKPTQYMALMKKDMGGAAHVLSLAHLIMAMKLPVNLHVFVPAVENAISGNAFRPGDVIKSRKGHTVENTNTDAEGRLILADALTAACEEKPDLVIDCATLTGSARAALGQEIPAFFSTNDKIGRELQELSFAAKDPLWQMPLYEDYTKLIKSDIADFVNSAGAPGDLIYSALFLKQFITEKIDWLHLDMFAWESAGKAGRPKGGADTGLRALFSLLEKKYG